MIANAVNDGSTSPEYYISVKDRLAEPENGWKSIRLLCLGSKIFDDSEEDDKNQVIRHLQRLNRDMIRLIAEYCLDNKIYRTIKYERDHGRNLITKAIIHGSIIDSLMKAYNRYSLDGCCLTVFELLMNVNSRTCGILIGGGVLKNLLDKSNNPNLPTRDYYAEREWTLAKKIMINCRGDDADTLTTPSMVNRINDFWQVDWRVAVHGVARI